EYNPTEAIATNIIGAQNIINVAIDRRVKRVLALSTDKAVSPVNLYGATKLVAEKLFIAGNNYSSSDGARFSCVRYGNVVGSRGSIVPLLLHQKDKGEITITDERMTRFWLTLEQGVRLVIDSIDLMTGGEIFVPKIPSMRLMDLAKTIAPKCRVKIVGIRPGEKLHETLISREEMLNTYELSDKFVIRPSTLFKAIPNDLWHIAKKTILECYSSDGNQEWLDYKGMEKMINVK
ncbi:MAG: UDP-N-acetylglucosamine 4,6-dehydratase (inverting), partial [Candidatus Nealsonbacteria bacterium RIFOXYC1_FULL_40_7]